MPNFSLKTSLLTLAFLALPAFVLMWIAFGRGDSTIESVLTSYSEAGKKTLTSLNSLPPQTLTESNDSFNLIDTTSDGMDIHFASEEKPTLTEEEQKATENKAFSLTFPKDYSKPMEVKLDDKRSILITDTNGNNTYKGTLYTDSPTRDTNQNTSLYTKFKNILFPQKVDAGEAKYLTYTDKDERKLISYVYQKDKTTGEKKLKEWVLYKTGNGNESESYSFQNAKLKLNEDGSISGYFFGQQDIQNQTAKESVDASLMERAERVLAKDMGEDILNSNQTPDFVIPRPYYINQKGDQTNLDWKVNTGTSTITVSFLPQQSDYPLALDPTLSFTAPGNVEGGTTITGEVGSSFGYRLASGDFNNDGKTDLVVGARSYSTSIGRAYIFYNDGAVATIASSADVVITGQNGNDFFGHSAVAGDFNADGKMDLAVGGWGYSGNTGRTYIFYNDGSYPTTAATADVIITGETGSDRFGFSFVTGDFNSDGKTDLAVGAYVYSSSAGRAYIFYNGSITTENASGADIIITGQASDNLGLKLISGDFNNDGKTDLVVGATGYSSNFGGTYFFYNDGSFGTVSCTTDCLAVNADTVIAGTDNTNFGYAAVAGDFNADGKMDLAVGRSALTGSAYIFYNDGSYPATAATADVTIAGETSSGFSQQLSSGDFNADGRTDLAATGLQYSANTGRVYIFYNDGSIPTTAATADVIITGEATNNFFGVAMVAGDFNTDGKTDLAVGAYGFGSTGAGKTYIFYSQNGQVNTNFNITGETTSNSFGAALDAADFNSDGRIDLAVGAKSYSSNAGRVYIFYNDGSFPTAAGSADIIISSESATYDQFGYALAVGDLNTDGKIDLVVGAPAYNSDQGRAYVFYNDGSFGTVGCTTGCLAANADVKIANTTLGDIWLGNAFAAGDFNADGRTDLAIGAVANYTSGAYSGSAYVFYNDGTFPTTIATADVYIASEAANDDFGFALASGDFNADGKIDLVIGAKGYSSDSGRTYIFYADGTSNFGTATCIGSPVTCNAVDADVIITGEGGLGMAFATGDFNSDGKMDLAVGAAYYPTSKGRVYIFYNDGSIPTTAATADAIITGLDHYTRFGWALVAGDFNADGKVDLAVGSDEATTRINVHIFYNPGTFSTMSASSADVKILGDAGGDSGDFFGRALVSGDFNTDGKTDLVVGATGYSSAGATGRVYIYETRGNYAWKVQPLPPTQALRTGLSGSGQEMQILGEAASDYFGYAMTSGDFNADGKMDLAVGAYGYSSNLGRTYIFYNTGSLTTAASSADVVIAGQNRLGQSLFAGDFNADGKTDLVVGAADYSSSTGRTYIFYNDGTYPAVASSADVIISGEAINNYFGDTFSSGDFNADGKTDLVVGANSASSSAGRVYVFYNDGSFGTVGCTTDCLATSADVIITGETGAQFGMALVTGDFNADGKMDLAVGAVNYSSSAGRVYVFYNDGSFGSVSCTTDCLAVNADVFITSSGSNDFGWDLVAGDFNSDGTIDLAASAPYYNTTGRVYIFYTDGGATSNFTATCTGTPSICTANNASAFIVGETGSYLRTLIIGDWNADGKTDLAIGGYSYSTSTGRTYIFYNDGSLPTTADTADVILTGEATSNYFGYALASGDFNADGKTDLAVGANGFSSNKGKVYIYTFNDPVITGEASSQLGYTMTSGDFNADGKVDLAVVGGGYATLTGRVYIFYNDNGPLPVSVTNADVIITGELAGDFFGYSMTAGDFNADGRVDLAVGAINYFSNTGRAYIFYNDGSIPTTAATADVIISGQGGSFGWSLASGDFNADGKTDLVVGAYGYSSSAGRAYIFYNDGSIPTTAATADVIISGEAGSVFGSALTSGDFNADGKTDLAVGGYAYSSLAGRVYIFYADGTNNFGTATCSGTPAACSAANADILIDGEASSVFGYAMTSGDFNADGKTDLVVGAYGYSANDGRVYIFYNDGSIPITADTADVILTGEVGTGSKLSFAFAVGDFNVDGKTDLAVGASSYSSSTGRTYIFYNDGSFPTTASAADVILTGETTSNVFGRSLSSGDFNNDGKIDLAVGASAYATNTGRVYIFTTEAVIKTIPDPVKLRGTTKFRGTIKIR